MIGSEAHTPHTISARRRVGHILVAVVGLLAVGASSVVAAGTGGGSERFTATFESRIVGDPTITSCRNLGLDGEKIEGRYRGTMTVDGEKFGIHFVLEALYDRAAGLGTAEGRWQLTDPRSSKVIGRGELIGVIAVADPPTEVNPPDPDLELQGLLIGEVNPPDPDMPAMRLLGNFTASLGDGATFPHLVGTVGDPTGVGDPTDGELLPAVMVASEGC